MRISVRQDDPGYHPQAIDCRAMVNGKEIERCFTADEEAGEAFCFATDANGDCILNEDRTDIVEIIYKGKVEIITPENFIKEL